MAPVFNQLPLAWIGLLGFPVMQIGRFIAGVIGRFAAELRYRRAVRDLRQLDGRMLADIGLVRSAIEAAVRGDAAAERPGYVKDRVTEGVCCHAHGAGCVLLGASGRVTSHPRKQTGFAI